MSFRSVIIISFFLLGFILLLNPSSAQLITDSQARLKTVEKEKSSIKKPQIKRSEPIPSSNGKRSVRYSKGNLYGGVIRAKEPRYSTGNLYGGVISAKEPRYSPGNLYGGVIRVKPPKYSEGMPFDNKALSPPPKFAKSSIGSYNGPYSISFSSVKGAHPSGKLLQSNNRSWNLFLVRFNGNKYQPEAVKDNVSKPKFDRKEKDIWNN